MLQHLPRRLQQRLQQWLCSDLGESYRRMPYANQLLSSTTYFVTSNLRPNTLPVFRRHACGTMCLLRVMSTRSARCGSRRCGRRSRGSSYLL